MLKARVATAATSSRSSQSWQLNGERPKPEEIGTDGPAVVGGVPGFYKADGGCDRATCGSRYAKRLEKAGAKVVYFQQPKPAKLADDSVKDAILGYCVADIELVTKAGTVILPRSHIDVLDGPETANLIYIGEAEEKRLKLRSYAEQLEDLAERGRKIKPKAPDKCSKQNCCDIERKVDAGTEGSGAGVERRERFKASITSRPVLADGHACIGEHNWQVLNRTASLCVGATCSRMLCDHRSVKEY